MGDRITRALQIVAGILGLGGYLALPSCQGRYSTLMTGSYDDITFRYYLGGILIGAAVLCLIGSFFIPSKKP